MSDAELVAEFIRRRGVTRCPPAAAAPTTAVLPPAAAAELERRGDAVGEAWRDKQRTGWAAYWKKRRGVAARKRVAP